MNTGADEHPPAAEYPAVRADWFEDRGRYPEALAAALRWVLDDPASDDPRLRYAGLCDRIAEAPCRSCDGNGRIEWAGKKGGPHEGIVPLHIIEVADGGSVPCPDCSGSGRGGERWRTRAEFVRVQCELAAMPVAVTGRLKGTAATRGSRIEEACPTCDVPEGNEHESGCRYDALRRRERELWDSGTGEGRDKRWLLHSDDFGFPFDRTINPVYYAQPPTFAGQVRGLVRRGFVERITLSLAALVGERCENCEGTGAVIEPDGPCPDCGGRFEPRDDEFDRGWSPGTGRTPGAGPAIFAAQPVTGVTLSDREPWESRDHNGQTDWSWVINPDEHGLLRDGDMPHFLPQSLWDLLSGYITAVSARVRARRYPTRDAALVALSAACVAWGRANAKDMTHEVPCGRCGLQRVLNPNLRSPRDVSQCTLCSGSGRVTRPGLGPLGRQVFD